MPDSLTKITSIFRQMHVPNTFHLASHRSADALMNTHWQPEN